MIDSHCHLYLKADSQKQEDLVREAFEAGVNTIVCIGIDLESSLKSIELAEKHEAVYATVGLHPHDARKFSAHLLNELRNLARHKKVVAIGECGLDYYRNLSAKEIQKEAFGAQLELAVETKKPLVIHTRESLEDAITMVSEYEGRAVGGVFHCFPGDSKDAARVFELGFHISFGGVITYRNSQMSKVAAEVELSRVILETDAPYLTPEPFRGQSNRPALVKQVYQKLAEIRKVSFAVIEQTVDNNCRKLFQLVETFEG
jgi:TatD DNase family protein